MGCNVDPGNEREIDAEEIRLKERHAIGVHTASAKLQAARATAVVPYY